MARAHWRDTLLVESDDVERVEGNLYFPRAALDDARFEPSDTRTRCAWKGEAHYLHVKAGGEVNRDAAWYYPDPLPAAQAIRGRVAFWKGVTVED